MNVLETKLVEHVALAKQLSDSRRQRTFKSPAQALDRLLQEDYLRDRPTALESEIDSEFSFAVKTAKDWGEISGLPDTVLDICVRSAGIDWVASRGPRVSGGTHSLVSFSKCLKWAENAANHYSTAGVEQRKALKTRLQTIYLALGDLIGAEWAKTRR